MVTGPVPPRIRAAPGRAPRAGAPRRAGSSGTRNAPKRSAGPRWCPARRSSALRCTLTGNRWAHTATPGRPAPAGATPCGADSPSPSSPWCRRAAARHADPRPSHGLAPAAPRRPDTVPSQAGDDAEDNSGLDQILDRHLVSGALQHLSPAHRTVLVETFYRGGTTATVARRLGIPDGTARSRLHYALKALREYLQEHDPNAR